MSCACEDIARQIFVQEFFFFAASGLQGEAGLIYFFFMSCSMFQYVLPTIEVCDLILLFDAMSL